MSSIASKNRDATVAAREVERALATIDMSVGGAPWGALARASAALEDDATARALARRFDVMTPNARRGALFASALSRRRVTATAALARAGAGDSDEWVRAMARAVCDSGDGGEVNRFDLDGVRASVPAISQAVTSIREAIRAAAETTTTTTTTTTTGARRRRLAYAPVEAMYLPKTAADDDDVDASVHGHFTLRERRQPRKKPTGGARGGRSSFEAAPAKASDASGRTSTTSMFVPARKPTGGASFLRDTGRVGSFNASRGGAGARASTGMPRPGSKTMLIDVAEAAELGKSARSREQEAKEKRIQKLMEEREARKKQEESRKRQRDEEIAAKKKAYKAEIEAKRARKERDSASIATPSPTDEPTMWS